MKRVILSIIISVLLALPAAAGPFIYGGVNVDLSSPGAIGSTTPAAGTFTTLEAITIKTAISADDTLSGTPVIITIYDKDTGTPYYFKAYPVKQ